MGEGRAGGPGGAKEVGGLSITIGGSRPAHDTRSTVRDGARAQRSDRAGPAPQQHFCRPAARSVGTCDGTLKGAR